jgi:hypothetical protein
MIMSWKNPHYAARKFHQVLALGLSDKTGVRANFEDALAAQLASAGVEAIPWQQHSSEARRYSIRPGIP